MTQPLKVSMPGAFSEEKKYVFGTISDFTGLKFEFKSGNEDYEIELNNGSKLIIRDSFFGQLGERNSYIDRELIPDTVKYLSCPYCEDLPVIFGNDSVYENTASITLGADIIAGMFFLLSRWEEAAVTEKDGHGRFSEDLAYTVKHGIIRRPVADEYANLLVRLLKKLDPSLSVKEHEPEILITSDVDSFRKFLPGKTLKVFAGHLLKRYNPFMFAADLFRYTAKLFGAKDPYDRFERIFTIAEKAGTKPVFFILTSPEGPYNDGWFTRTASDTELFRELRERGAEIGLHYGYFSLLNENNIRSEKFELEHKYGVTAVKGRAHFLQFDVRSSYEILELAGIEADHTMGYSRHAGFRCGTGRAYRPWDIDRRMPHKITERPLVVMDTTLYAHNRLRKEAITGVTGDFIRTAQKYGTDITILLHNSSPSYVLDAVEDAIIKFRN